MSFALISRFFCLVEVQLCQRSSSQLSALKGGKNLTKYSSREIFAQRVEGICMSKVRTAELNLEDVNIPEVVSVYKKWKLQLRAAAERFR